MSNRLGRAGLVATIDPNTRSSRKLISGYVLARSISGTPMSCVHGARTGGGRTLPCSFSQGRLAKRDDGAVVREGRGADVERGVVAPEERDARGGRVQDERVLRGAEFAVRGPVALFACEALDWSIAIYR